jgi:hypothetical protein
MLGWEFFISEQKVTSGAGSQEKRPTLACWMAGIGGIRWILDLADKGIVQDLGGNGYPNRYIISAGALLRVLADGIPKYADPPVFGDDYFLPPGWIGEAKIDLEALRALDPFSLLLVEAWDQS